MGPTTRTQVLDRACDLLREGGVLSLDSVARAAGLTKPGLMYHFPTKQALVLGVVDHVTEGYRDALARLLPGGLDESAWTDRVRAYVDWACTAELDAADLVVFSDPRLRDALAERWSARMSSLVDAPLGTPRDVEARVTAARLLADGVWLATALGTPVLTPAQLTGVRTVAEELLEVAP